MQAWSSRAFFSDWCGSNMSTGLQCWDHPNFCWCWCLVKELETSFSPIRKPISNETLTSYIPCSLNVNSFDLPQFNLNLFDRASGLWVIFYQTIPFVFFSPLYCRQWLCHILQTQMKACLLFQSFISLSIWAGKPLWLTLLQQKQTQFADDKRQSHTSSVYKAVKERKKNNDKRTNLIVLLDERMVLCVYSSRSWQIVSHLPCTLLAAKYFPDSVSNAGWWIKKKGSGMPGKPQKAEESLHKAAWAYTTYSNCSLQQLPLVLNLQYYLLYEGGMRCNSNRSKSLWRKKKQS